MLLNLVTISSKYIPTWLHITIHFLFAKISGCLTCSVVPNKNLLDLLCALSIMALILDTSNPFDI